MKHIAADESGTVTTKEPNSSSTHPIPHHLFLHLPPYHHLIPAHPQITFHYRSERHEEGNGQSGTPTVSQPNPQTMTTSHAHPVTNKTTPYQPCVVSAPKAQYITAQRRHRTMTHPMSRF